MFGISHIIDERNNGGGSAADYMIDIMNRQLFGFFNSAANDRRPWTTPMAGIWGPKVMIINERAGSGGDLLPYMFKAAKIGTEVFCGPIVKKFDDMVEYAKFHRDYVRTMPDEMTIFTVEIQVYYLLNIDDHLRKAG